jgi:hypothetical protein
LHNYREIAMSTSTNISTVSIDTAANHVWEVLADGFLDNAAWTPGVISSAANPATPHGLNGSRHGGRVLDIEGLGKADVRLVGYDAPTRMLSYTLEAENVPPFIERLHNTWTVTPDGDQRCTVAAELAITVASSMSESDGAKKVVGGMFASIGASLTALKTYIESETDV